jgi:asparagine synthase (glutamine-hydrolysing)
MCGIHGLYQLDGKPAAAEWLTRMGNVTTHRGPDDSGAHVDGRCAIGMRRLSIIDLSGGHQPIANADRSLVVVCNGEIYNYRELRRQLQAQGHHFSTESDSEVVLYGYAQWGERFVEHLNGMFGFAIWDAKQQTMLVGRDRLGIKPIYWLEDAHRVAFASEAKSPPRPSRCWSCPASRATSTPPRWPPTSSWGTCPPRCRSFAASANCRSARC